MISKITKKFKNLLNTPQDVGALLKKIEYLEKSVEESVWANVYHDSIRGYSALEKLPLNIGRWAGNYSFFYLLNRILKDFQPENILELGLGESTKFISTYVNNYLPNAHHHIAEHDPVWIDFFSNNFQLSSRSEIKEIELEKGVLEKNEYYRYKDFTNQFSANYDFILIDGPFGCNPVSRYDVIGYIHEHEFSGNFVILLDDTNRAGEQNTLATILHLLRKKRSDIYYSTFAGLKSCTVITNQKFLTSI